MTELTDKQARLLALKKIRDSGVENLRHGDEGVGFRSMTDLQKAIAALEREIAVLSGTTRGPKYIYQSGKGL